jgi:hypothetical protein
VFVLALAVLAVLIVATGVLAPPPTVAMPALHGHTLKWIDPELRRLHLSASVTRRYDERAKPGTAVAQTPTPGTQIKQDSTVDVVLSRGPRPIAVPSLKGKSSSDAASQLRRIHLSASIKSVAAPGTQPGVVTGQSPGAGRDLHQHQTVTLFVAETPTWKSVTSFSGAGDGSPTQFTIRGPQWRVVYQMSYDGTCDFVLFCDGPKAQVLGPTNASFSLSEGSGQTKVFKSGAGAYQIQIQPGLDNARWSITVEDWY